MKWLAGGNQRRVIIRNTWGVCSIFLKCNLRDSEFPFIPSFPQLFSANDCVCRHTTQIIARSTRMVKNYLFGSYLNGPPIIFIFKYGSLNCPDDLVLPYIFNLVSLLFFILEVIFFSRLIRPLHTPTAVDSLAVGSLCQIFLHLLFSLWCIHQSSTLLYIPYLDS